MNFELMKEYLVAAAKAAGLTEYEIYATSSREMSTETLKGEISSFSLGESGGISFRCIVDGKMGYASGELLTREEMEFSYVDGMGYHFLNTETYEDVCVGEDIVEPVKDYLIEGGVYVLLFTDEIVCSIELPAAITMEVAEAPEGVKGNSANNVYKSATMTTGLVVQVPLFITAGQRISVKTEDGTYLGRVNN